MKKETIQFFNESFIFFEVKKSNIAEENRQLLKSMLIEIGINNRKPKKNFTINKFEYDNTELIMEGENIPSFVIKIFKRYSSLFSKTLYTYKIREAFKNKLRKT